MFVLIRPLGCSKHSYSQCSEVRHVLDQVHAHITTQLARLERILVVSWILGASKFMAKNVMTQHSRQRMLLEDNTCLQTHIQFLK